MKEYCGQPNPKLSCFDVILEIMDGGKMGMSSSQTIQFQLRNLVMAVSWSGDGFLQMVLQQFSNRCQNECRSISKYFGSNLNDFR